MEIQIANCDRVNAVRSAEQNHSRLYLLLYRKLLKQLMVGGAAILLALPAFSATFRWANSSNRIYVENGGSATLSDIKAALPNAPLDLVDAVNRVWLLRANMLVEDGTVLVLHGASVGGDVSEFRLQSKNSSAAGSFVSVTADYGGIDVKATKITSWNTSAGAADTEYANYGRAFVRVRSKLAADGVTPLESRMDVVDSEICYLGYDAAESYGLVWKVIGSQSDLFDRVQVRGNIINSRIHHNWFGVYTYGAQDCQWLDNEIYSNVQYGFDPHDDSDDLLIEGNNVHHNGNHGIIASKRCDHVVIRNNLSWANAKNGIMLHRHCDDSIIEDNETYLNGDSGIALFDNDRTLVRNNLVLSNSNAGIRFSVGSADNIAEDNEIGFSGEYGFYFYPGSDPAEPDPVDPTVTNRLRRNRILNNYVHDCEGEGIKLADGDDNWFTGNTFVANGSKIRFTTSTGTLFISNSIPTDVTVKLEGSSSVDNFVYFSGQPFVKLEMDPYSSGSYFEDYNNAIFDVGEDVYTTASGVPPNASSALTLMYDQIGSSTTVVMRDFFAYTEYGTVWVNPTLWNVTGDLTKVWKAYAVSDSPIDYVVGDLTPGVSYVVSEGPTYLGSFIADAGGRIGFSVIPGTTSIVTYSVDPL